MEAEPAGREAGSDGFSLEAVPIFRVLGPQRSASTTTTINTLRNIDRSAVFRYKKASPAVSKPRAFFVSSPLIREAEAARAIGDVERVEQAVHRLDEILLARDAGTGGEQSYTLRSSSEALDEELRAIMRGKYDKT
jgi:hypothetical protein